MLQKPETEMLRTSTKRKFAWTKENATNIHFFFRPRKYPFQKTSDLGNFNLKYSVRHQI